eukprot:TRINITY_DN8681_c0_g1_i1.p1 TRINITY_DN8681_c0_g1~~TRINITY_DN8681_c0_g1_i1.p1  ORF type:complete len:214 (-),score=38.70 TRINITY_DN8681_c0_g1_i1:512-1153(-)
MGAGIGKEPLQSLINLGGGSGYHCVMIGLDGSGKTTILYRLKYGQYTNTVPTIGFNCEKVKTNIGKVFNIWDVGGQDKTRPLWRSYTRCTDAIIFVVDSSDSDRLEEAKLELLKIAKLTERYSVPIMVLANKQDLPLAQDLVKLEKGLGLKDLGRNVGWAVKSCCAVTGEGLDEAFSNLQELIVKKKRTGSRPPSANKGRLHKKVQRSHSHHF